MRARGFVLAVLVACGGEKTLPPTEAMPVSQPSPDVVDAASAKARIGSVVHVQGTAGDAKLGAVITLPDLIVYCDSLLAWPPDLVGKTVTGHGVLDQSSEAIAKREPDGAITQGTDGPIWVLHNCAMN